MPSSTSMASAHHHLVAVEALCPASLRSPRATLPSAVTLYTGSQTAPNAQTPLPPKPQCPKQLQQAAPRLLWPHLPLLPAFSVQGHTCPLLFLVAPRACALGQRLARGLWPRAQGPPSLPSRSAPGPCLTCLFKVQPLAPLSPPSSPFPMSGHFPPWATPGTGLASRWSVSPGELELWGLRTAVTRYLLGEWQGAGTLWLSKSGLTPGGRQQNLKTAAAWGQKALRSCGQATISNPASCVLPSPARAEILPGPGPGPGPAQWLHPVPSPVNHAK